MEEEVAFFQCGFDGFCALDDRYLRKALGEDGIHAVIDTRGPEADFGFGEFAFEDVEDAGGVGDVADVDGLPGGTEEDFRRFVLPARGEREKGRGEGGGEEVAAG